MLVKQACDVNVILELKCTAYNYVPVYHYTYIPECTPESLQKYFLQVYEISIQFLRPISINTRRYSICYRDTSKYAWSACVFVHFLSHEYDP